MVHVSACVLLGSRTGLLWNSSLDSPLLVRVVWWQGDRWREGDLQSRNRDTKVEA